MKFNFSELLQKTGEVGYVSGTNSYIVYVQGIPSVGLNELILFENGALGVAVSLGASAVAVLLYNNRIIPISTRAVRCNIRPFIDIDKTKMYGSVVNSFGFSESLSIESFQSQEFSFIHQSDTRAAGLHLREKVHSPVLSGVFYIDLMVPLGKGQRELIIGDKQSGKTVFALQVAANLSNNGYKCVYACIGKKKAEIEDIKNYLHSKGTASNIIIVSSAANDPVGLILHTPYSAMATAEEICSAGLDVLVVLDDLTSHAKYYREMSLLLRRFPGRSAYPGDIFYLHSRLLERAGNFKKGSITCLPIVNTVEGDISGYIQTNIMSMTDGHLFFDRNLFYAGQKPAVNTYYSVTRVGRQTQNSLRWSINRELNSFYSLVKRTQKFVHFGAEISEGIKSTINTYEKLSILFNQSPGEVIHLNLQIFLFCIVWSGIWGNKENEELRRLIKVVKYNYNKSADFMKMVDSAVEKADVLNTLLGELTKMLPRIESFLYKEI